MEDDHDGGSLTGKNLNVGKRVDYSSFSLDAHLQVILTPLENKRPEVFVVEKMLQEVPNEWFAFCDRHSKVFHQVILFFPNPEEVMARGSD